MLEYKLIDTICCPVCHLSDSCETKQKREVRGEKQICCPFCERFPQCNPTFYEIEQPDYSKKLIKVIENSVKERQFITAHHFALLLPTKDFPTLKDLKDVYIDALSENKDQQVLNEGMLLFHNLFDHVERKTPVLINLAYFEEYLNPDDADQAALKALEEKPPLEYIIKFYRWLRDDRRKVSEHLKRLSMVSQKAKNDVLQKLCKDLEEINLLRKSKDHESLLQAVEGLGNFISQFRDYIDVAELGKLINRLLNNIIENLTDFGKKYSKSSESEKAVKCYEGAAKGFKLFTEFRPAEIANFLNLVIFLGKLLDVIRASKPNGESERKVVEEIKAYTERAVRITPPFHELGYSVCLKLYALFQKVRELNEREEASDEAIRCFEKEVECFNRVLEKFDPARATIEAARIFWKYTLDKSVSLRNFGVHSRVIECCERLLNIYPERYEGYLTKGDVLMEMDRSEEAEQCYKKCIELKSNDVPAYDKLKILYRKTGRYKEAIRTWVKYMKLPPIKNDKKHLDWGFFELARLWEDWENDKVAANLFKHIISKRQPDHLEVHYRLARIYIKQFRWKDAIPVLENKILLPDNEPFSDYCSLGDCYKNIGDRNKAIEFYKRQRHFLLKAYLHYKGLQNSMRKRMILKRRLSIFQEI